MTEFQVGEIVDITIRGVRVESATENYVGFRLNGLQHGVLTTAPEVTVDQVASDWPPRPGQVWRSADGREFFIRRHRCTHERSACLADIELIDATGDEPPYPVQTTVPAGLRPLTRVYPEPEDGAR